MTSLSVLRQGAPYALFKAGFWKSDHDFPIAFRSNFLYGMHGFPDNKILLQAGYYYDVIVPNLVELISRNCWKLTYLVLLISRWLLLLFFRVTFLTSPILSNSLMFF